MEFQSNISFTFSSADPYYSNLIVEEFPVLIEDNDEDSVVLTGGINWKQSGDRYNSVVLDFTTVEPSNLRNICRIRQVKIVYCVQRLCRIEIIMCYTCVGLGRFHLYMRFSLY